MIPAFGIYVPLPCICLAPAAPAMKYIVPHMIPSRIQLICSALTILLILASFLMPKDLGKDPKPYHKLEVTQWAKEPMLQNPVGISLDRDGRVYATEANRRRTADLDVRGMGGLEPVIWPALDYSIQSVEERRTVLREYLATDTPYSNPWLKDYNKDGVKNWEDLRAKTERLNVLEDTDGDGVADKATVFAEGFNTEVTGTAGGVLWHDEQVYFAVIPDLWLLKDEDGDDVADERTVLHTGHGVHIGQGGHDLHGLTVGPDGRIYWTIGDKGINITSKEGRHFMYPNQGVVMRSEPDGSNFEVFAHGLRNCMEIAFDDFGNLFCVDNDGDFKGERERLLYVTRGSDTGWRINWQYNHTDSWAKDQRLPMYNPWMEEGLWKPQFEGQAAYITPPLQNYSDGPAGFVRNPGTALSESYSDYFFVTQFPGKLITAFQLQPKGAAFEMTNEHTFHDGFMATGLRFGPAGDLFIADWSGQWTPTEEGGIFRIDVEAPARHPMRAETERLIQEGMAERPVDELTALLAFPDQRVRLDAQFELVKRNEAEKLVQTAFDKEMTQLQRVHSLWGMGQLARAGKLALNQSINPLLADDEDKQIQIQAMRLIQEAPVLFATSERRLIEQLRSSSAQVQFHAAMALGSVGTTHAVPSLVNMLARNNDADAFIRHAAISGLAGIGEAAALQALIHHPSNAVRLGAVVALRRLKSPEVTAFLEDDDELVVLEAARAIHDDFGIPEAMPVLANLINTTLHVNNEALMRRVLNANLRLRNLEYAAAILAFASNDAHPEYLQQEAIDILYTWAQPSMLDRVERRARQLTVTDPDEMVDLIEGRLAGLLSSSKPNVVSRVFQLTRHYGITLDPADLQQRLADENRSAIERIEVLGMLSNQQRYAEKAFRTAFESSNEQLRIAALEMLANKDERAALKRIEAVLEKNNALAERQKAFNLLAALGGQSAEKLLSKWVDRLAANEVIPEEQLDVYLAAEANGTFAEELQKLRTTGAPQIYAMAGGNAERGATLFEQHPGAQCIRCHAVDDGSEGSNVGPNLRDIGKKQSPAYLMESLISPAASMAEGFETPNNISVMPAMGEILTPQELRDMIAYLSQL